MKLLVFSPYYPPHIGGLESHADEFNKYLSQKGIDITVFTPCLPQDAPESEIRHNNVHPVKSSEAGPVKQEFNGVRIIRFPAFEIISNYPLPKFWLLKFWQLFLALYKEKFDIVISRTRFFNTSLLALIYAKIKKVKWIHIEHGSDFIRLSSPFKTLAAKLYDYTFGWLIFRSSDLNISISKAVQNFVEKFDKRESPVIYRGLDLERIDKIEPDHKLRDKYKDKIILSFVGRLYKWKGIENSIKAVNNLPPEIKNKLAFIVAGGGEEYDRLKKAADESVVMLGHTPTEKAISLLKISDIYLHSAYPGGGLSTSLLEAMYCGCAIIATKNEGAEEVIKNNENGLLIENSDPELISKQIIKLVENENQRKQLSGANKQKLLELFNWNTSIKKYLEYLLLICRL